MSQELRHTTCTACRTRECCSHFLIELTGADLQKISRTLRVAPAQFAEAVPYDKGNPKLGFTLAQGGERLHMVLKKQPVRVKLKPCVFLLTLKGGRKLCGLGDLRPDQCQMFPVLQVSGIHVTAPALYNGPGCWRTWHLGELNIAAETERLTAQQRAIAEYSAHITAWNQFVARQHSAFAATFPQFATFILNRYAESPALPPAATQTQTQTPEV